ncbi:GerAB/ArcD/ProY family transporter [Paenibacillus eucommiae]|uniref:Spore germination protein (Amino acid permease) n=1 Tax=Paenibacillus eucommiae TaxID=1355755 RepID=A0ABS4JAQ2_9BACL|nr:GerAB/ArcD/ProY family transporter [Paenibacillus eucommiae]MBP1996928.1 spore germination protein (amino acid permease) [Paenibacillus eucommiae]
MNRTITSISLFQLFALIVQAQFGSEELVLPNKLYQIAQQDSWLIHLLAGFLVQLVIIVLWFLLRRHPDMDVFQIGASIMGKWLGGILNLVYTSYFLFLGAFLLVRMYMFLNKWVYPMTPDWVLLSLIVGACCYIGAQRLRAIGRFYSITLITTAAFILIALYAFQEERDWLNLLPIAKTGWKSWVRGLEASMTSLIGFEMMLIFVPRTKGTPKQVLWTVMAANGFVVLIHVLLILVSLVYFSPEELQYLPEPIIYMTKTYSFVFVERIDLVYLSFWIVSSMTCFTINVYAGSIGLAQTFRRKGRTHFLYGGMAICLGVAIWMDRPFIIDHWIPFIHVYALFIIVVIPLVLLAISALWKKGEANVS